SPELRPITLPPAPTIDVDDIVFEGVTPVFDATPPDPNDFSFDNAEYTPLMLDEIRQKVMSVFNGETGLPPAVEQALFERAREREIELGDRDVQQARDEWGARGWKHPPGQLNAATNRARSVASAKVSQLNRDQFIEHNKMKLEMLREAMSHALALEEVWV